MKYFNKLFILSKVVIILWYKIHITEGIVGGKYSELGDFKYMVSIQVNDEHICGGAIIGKYHILTAAHCFIDDDNKFINRKYNVFAGANNLKKNNLFGSVIEVKIIYVPKLFQRQKRTPSTLYYKEIGDIAVLMLQKSYNFESQVTTTVQLPQRSDTNYFTKFYEEIRITGFGSDTSSVNRGVKRNNENEEISQEPKHINIMKYAEIKILPTTTCGDFYPFADKKHYLCARLDQSSTVIPFGACFGDDGAPLVINGKTVIGILAQFQLECNEVLIPSLYTRVAAFKTFIKNALSHRKLDEMRTATYVKTKNSTFILDEDYDLEEV